MTANAKLRHYVVLAPNERLENLYRDGFNSVLGYICDYVYGPKVPAERSGMTVVDLPAGSVTFGPSRLKVNRDRGSRSKFTDAAANSLVVALEFDGIEQLNDLRLAIARDLSQNTVIATGVDIALDATEFWSPKEASDGIFGHRSAAERLLGADYVRDTKKLRGANVNVLVVDRGIDFSSIPAKNRGTGWSVGTVQPGVTKGGHGMMIVRNILSVAPDATVHDLPLLPERIGNIKSFLSLADTAFTKALSKIKEFKQLGQEFSGPWVMVNAWAIFDRQTENPPGDYTDRLQHPFNQQIVSAVADDIDVIFCAGNCGQFCPDGRCGVSDWGPGRSILGANSHPDVLTVGAVRSDARWLGYSSQGPGQPNLARPNQPKSSLDKPDLCAPSQFREDYDAHLTNTGTSAASGLAAGVVAALRSKWDATAVSPAQLKTLLIDTARKTQGPAWNPELGNGIMNARDAYDALP